MYIAFQGFTALFGSSRGYVLGFLFYWAVWCIALPIGILKPSGVASLFREGKPRFGKHPALTILIIAWPITLPLATFFIPNVLSTSATAIILSIILGGTIGITEELFWRGVYIKLFPNMRFLGYIYPSITFGLWHLAPLSIQSSNVPGGAFSFVLVSVLLGLSWGFYAQKTGSIRWSTTAHILNDTFGLGGIRWLPMLLSFL
jgi:membrane protease YdiL (CAAX protease family)